ncbi:hypothetical protein Tco_0385598 [Tanacetum coccineum]
MGYPDWYKRKKNKRRGKIATQFTTDFDGYMHQDTPFDFAYENEVHGEKSDVDQRMVAKVCQEMIQMFKGKNVDQSNVSSTSKPHAGTYFYGCKPFYLRLSFHVSLNALPKHLNLDITIDWIVDTRASDHMSPHLHLFQSIRILKCPIKIKLPDGTRKLVTKAGNIQINSSLALFNVFYVLEFQVNLLFVGKLLKTQSLIAVFFPTMFVFQDPSTRQVLAYGEGLHNLYIYKPSNSKSTKTQILVFPALSSFVNKVVHSSDVTVNLFHARLGHTSVSKMIHVDNCKHEDLSHFNCDTCLLANQHKLHFPKSNTRSLIPFELLHVDLWGTYKTSTLNGAHYFFTLWMIILDVLGLI